MRHLITMCSRRFLMAFLAGFALWSSTLVAFPTAGSGATDPPKPALACGPPTLPISLLPGATLVCYTPDPNNDKGCGKGHDIPCCPDGTNPKNNGNTCANPSPNADPKSTAGNVQSANGGAFPGAGFLFPGLSFFQNLGTQFAQKARDAALRLYFVLFVIEFAMFSIQFLLFKGDNMGEFFASLTFKIFVAGFFIWLISNAATIFPTIVNSFSQAGQDISGADMGMLGKLAGWAIGLGVAFIGVASVAQGVDQLEGGLEGIMVLGNGSPGLGFGGEIGHMYLIQACLCLAFLVFGSLLVIVMTLVIITVESYIVMTAGIFFLGFAGTRFTMPYAQGYMTYAINVGAKMFAFWMVIRVENEMLNQNGMSNLVSLAPLFAAAVIPNGITSLLALPFGIFLAFEFMILSAVAFAIPSLAGSFLSGASSMSATSTMGNLMNTFNAAGSMSSGFRSAINSGMSKLGITGGSSERAMARLEKRAGKEESGRSDLAPSLTAGGEGDGGPSARASAGSFGLPPPSKAGKNSGPGLGIGPDLSTPQGNQPKFNTPQYQTPGAEAGAFQLASDNGNGGGGSGGGGDSADDGKAESLSKASPSEIANMPALACAQRYAATRTGSLSKEQRQALKERRMEDPLLNTALKSINREKMQTRKDEMQRKMNNFNSGMQQALLPDNDDAARHGGSAKPFGTWGAGQL